MSLPPSSSEIAVPGDEKVNEPEPFSEEASEVVERTAAEECEASDVPTTVCDPGIIEYVQPVVRYVTLHIRLKRNGANWYIQSPYECEAATILIGRSKKRYTVPINIIKRAPSLQWHQNGLESRVVRLPEINEDVGHTFIHYLYTGNYQTLKPSSTCDMPRHAIEYSRSVLAYHAALSCGLDGLAGHAREYMQTFDKDIPIFDIIALGRKNFPRITEDTWFSEYLTAKIMASFEADEQIFQREEFLEGFGKALDFDKFLVKVIAKAYTHKMSTIRDEAGLKSMSDRSTPPMMDDGENIANNKCDGVSKAQATYREQCSHSEFPPKFSQEHSPKVVPSDGDDAWLKCEEDEYNEVGPSPTSLLTTYSSPDEKSADQYAEKTSSQDLRCQSDDELGCGVCPHWKRHSTHENLYMSCPRCKSYVLNMFARLLLNGA